MEKYRFLSLCTILLISFVLPLSVQAEDADYNHPNVVYLTFDDGPGDHTTDILSILENYNEQATFFVLEPYVRNHPKIAQQIIDQGHTLGSHGVTHSREKFYASSDNAVSEMIAAQKAIQEITGFYSEFIRVPYGTVPHLTPSTKKALTNKGLKIWDWNVDSRDWLHKSSPEQIVENVMNGLVENERNNIASVVLFHDVLPQAVDALPEILDYLQEKNYELRVIDNDTPAHNFHNQWSFYGSSQTQTSTSQRNLVEKENSLPDEILTVGSTGTAVEQVQSALNLVGFSLTVDGIYGPKMQEAVQSFQSEYSLSEDDGIYGTQTKEILEQEKQGESSDNSSGESIYATPLQQAVWDFREYTAY
ncbi:polysaccharide deacetylase family protein [Salipaludibacillus sp. HK11]|uniref:polysaccharide deacetylase family protein n=1 Tax=Salipaludibacillus sp. HK11 TaxID=3394320 RepID=UPI0039FB89D3